LKYYRRNQQRELILREYLASVSIFQEKVLGIKLGRGSTSDSETIALSLVELVLGGSDDHAGDRVVAEEVTF